MKISRRSTKKNFLGVFFSLARTALFRALSYLLTKVRALAAEEIFSQFIHMENCGIIAENFHTRILTIF